MVNVSVSYFNSLKSAVDSSVCDVVIAETVYTAERAKLVKYTTCGYGSTSYGFLRGALDNSTISISNVNDLNNPAVKISVVKGSIFDTYVNQSLPLAQKVYASYGAQMQLVADGVVHAVVDDAVGLNQFRLNNMKDCTSCFVKLFGDVSTFSAFTELTTKSNGAFSIFNTLTLLMMCTASLFISFLVIL